MVSSRKKKSRKPFLKTPYILGIVVLVIIAGLAIWKWESNSTPTHQNTVSGSSFSDKGQPASSGTTTGTTTPNQQTGSSQPGSSSKSNTSPSSTSTPVNLVAPTGNFVSSHDANSSSVEASVCNTNPNVTCVITFISGGTTVSLPAKTTDGGGTAYWNSWTPMSVGLTPGTWTIQATASSGSQSKSTQDALSIKVSQ